MIVLTVCYETAIAFDAEYFNTTHVPMIENQREHGLRGTEFRML